MATLELAEVVPQSRRVLGLEAQVDELLRRGGGVIAIAEHPALRSTIHRLASSGHLVSLLPGVYARTSEAADPLVRIRAASRWSRDAVITGEAAAWLTFWRDLRLSAVTVSGSVRRVSPRGFVATRDVIPPELCFTMDGMRVTRPALTALDLVATQGGAGIDRALLKRACTLADMREALRLTPRRRGNAARRAMLHDSRDEPWSEAERLLHAILRQAGIGGWSTNHWVPIGARGYYVDLTFVSRKLAIEVDGYEEHRKRAQFEKDRHKWSDLQTAGWRVLHFTWWQLVDERDWVIATVRAALSGSRRPRRGRSRGHAPERRSAAAPAA